MRYEAGLSQTACVSGTISVRKLKQYGSLSGALLSIKAIISSLWTALKCQHCGKYKTYRQVMVVWSLFGIYNKLLPGLHNWQAHPNLILISFGANFLISLSSRSPKTETEGTRDRKLCGAINICNEYSQNSQLSHTFKQSRTSRQYNVWIQNSSQVHVRLLNSKG